MLPFLQRLTAMLTAAAVAMHLLCGCCRVAHAEQAVESHAVAAEHECEHHHDSHSEQSDEEPCRQHCSVNCSPATADRSDVAVPAPFDAAATLLTEATPVVEVPAVVRLVEPAYLPAPPQSLPVLHCALRN